VLHVQEREDHGSPSSPLLKVARDLWVSIFPLFNVERVIPKRVGELLACWEGQLEASTF
jgi:hypothetical protein